MIFNAVTLLGVTALSDTLGVFLQKGDAMSRRRKMNRSESKGKFTYAAQKVHSINNYSPYRGGIRL